MRLVLKVREEDVDKIIKFAAVYFPKSLVNKTILCKRLSNNYSIFFEFNFLNKIISQTSFSEFVNRGGFNTFDEMNNYFTFMMGSENVESSRE